MSQPLLSIGMIVKNEERCLEKCLKALDPLRQAIPCELVIADTGSTDRTKEIASKYADVLFDFEWVNDFSVARNAVMDRCSGKWYLTLDADEYLVPNIDELVTFLTSKNAEIKKQATIIQRNHFAKDMDGAYSDFNAMRMCRLDTGARYISTIHEHFNQQITYDDIYMLSSTIFDHDGYAYVSPEYKARKEARNLELLRKKLDDEPNNLKIILQCLESSATNTESRRYFSKYGIEKLQKATQNDPYWNSSAAVLAKQIALYLNHDSDPYQEEWFDWTFKKFPQSEHTMVDVNYSYTKYLFNKKRYIDCIKSGKDFLKALARKDKRANTSTIENFTGSLLHSHEFHKNEIKTLIAYAMIKENREEEAFKLLLETELYKQNNTVINNWFAAIIELKQTDKVTEQASKYIYSILKKYSDSPHSSFDYLFSRISLLFQVTDADKKHYNLFGKVLGTIGLSAKIADSKNKAEAEKFLNQIENWEEFMPVALKQAILLKATLPEDFYLMSSSRLTYLINDLAKIADELSDILINEYCTADYCNCFPQASFIYNLLLVTLTGNNVSLSDEIKSKLIDAFIFVADKFLVSCYNSELLKNEEFIVCIPTLHLFSWYLVKANKLKSENPLEYIKTLRTLINKIPQSKQVVEFLIEIFQKEAEIKKQEKIKNTSPELLKMAEQLKTMLSALPENSPELMAIKQSPVYKQLAFLIED